MLAWNFLDDFLEKERPFIESGGEFIVPVPELRVIGRSDLRHRIVTADTEAVVLFGAGGFVGGNIVSALQESVPTMYGVTCTGSPVAGRTLTLPGDRLEELPALPTETVVINVASHRYDASDLSSRRSRRTFHGAPSSPIESTASA